MTRPAARGTEKQAAKIWSELAESTDLYQCEPTAIQPIAVARPKATRDTSHRENHGEKDYADPTLANLI